MIKSNLSTNKFPTKGTGFSSSFTAFTIPIIQRISNPKLKIVNTKSKEGTIYDKNLLNNPKIPNPKDCFKWNFANDDFSVSLIVN